MRNGKPVTWTCPLKIECVDCGEVYWCYSDQEIEILEKEKIEAQKQSEHNIQHSTLSSE